MADPTDLHKYSAKYFIYVTSYNPHMVCIIISIERWGSQSSEKLLR